MRRTMRRRISSERAQAIILFVGLITVVFAVAAVAVDFSLYMSERRGAQKDADASTLAGAQELLAQDFVNVASNDFNAVRTAAEDAAYDWAGRNGVPPEDVHNLAVTDSDCFGVSFVLDSIALDAEHHSTALFSSIFGVAAPEIGAHARVCLGSIISAEGLLPVGIQVEAFDSDCWRDVDGDGQKDPIYGAECTLTFGGGDFTSGEGGALKLLDDGSLNCSARNTGGGRTYGDELSAGGANTTCYVLPPEETCDSFPAGCVWPQTGNLVGQERDGYSDLLSGEGDCDREYGDEYGNVNGIDDFDEVVAVVSGGPFPAPTTYAERDCDLDQEFTQHSPRLVSLIIIDEFTAQGNPEKPILAFASFYIKQCENDDDPPQVSEVCDFRAIGNPGKIILRGRFVNILATAGTVGAINKWSPKRIILTE